MIEAAQEILKKYWGHDTFRPLQAEIINAVIERKDTIALLPTGGGKSICYQIPALLNKGMCLVISPLVSLMNDQVNRLQSMGIAALALHAGLDKEEMKDAQDALLQGTIKILYVSPERIQTSAFKDLLLELPVDLIAIDEAHCISQWGYDFRPEYLAIKSLRYTFPKATFLALTATATTAVVSDIQKKLNIHNKTVFKTSFERENIFISVIQADDKINVVIRALQKEEVCSIVYCRSRKQTERLVSILEDWNIRAVHYHAGMTKEAKARHQEDWMQGKVPVMIATTAFGMGIDKSNVRLVIHYDLPEQLESYYQEIGRAGRDGQAAEAICIYNEADIKRLKDQLTIQFPPVDYLRKLYQCLVEYLQIPIGANPNKYFSFDLLDFANKFSLNATQANYGLKLLAQDNLWTITDSVQQKEWIQFIADRSTIDSLQQAYPTLSIVCITLLRMYSGIYYYPTSIHIVDLSKKLRTSFEETRNLLNKLHSLGFINYQAPVEGPKIWFHHTRVASEHLIVNEEQIAFLRNRQIERLKALFAFIKEKDKCRNQILLPYFGEEKNAACMHCDICESARKMNIQKSTILIEKDLIEFIKKNSGLSLDSLYTQFNEINKETLHACLRQLIDDNKISYKDQLFY